MCATYSKTTAASATMTTKKAKASASRIYSNKMEEAVKTFCWLCDQVISLSGLTKHLRGVHKESAVEYREKFGEPKKQLLKLVFHKCGICSKDILLDYLVLVKHLRKAHRIKGAATSEYNSKYMDMIQPKTRKLKPKETPTKSQTGSFSTPPSTPFTAPKPPSSLHSHSPASSISSSPGTSSRSTTSTLKNSTSSILPPSPTPSPATSPRLAPVPQCSTCSRQFKSNMHLKMHLRKEH